MGGTARVSELDTVNVRYSHVQSEYTRSSTSSFFNIDSATIGWSRTLTHNLRTELGGGGILISPGQTTYAANASLTMNFLNNRATISYVRSAFPSYANTGEPLIGDRFSLSAIHKIGRQWQLSETANYMHSSGAGGIDRNTYFTSVGLDYWMTSIWSTGLSYEYMNYNAQFGSATNNYDRHVIMFSVKASWG